MHFSSNFFLLLFLLSPFFLRRLKRRVQSGIIVTTEYAEKSTSSRRQNVELIFIFLITRLRISQILPFFSVLHLNRLSLHQKHITQSFFWFQNSLQSSRASCPTVYCSQTHFPYFSLDDIQLKTLREYLFQWMSLSKLLRHIS